MSEDDFNVDDFMAMPPRERVRICIKLAERAQALADAAEPHFQRNYLKIAKEWITLADEMQRVIEAGVKTGN
jgi:hypothetical protein